MLNDIGTYLQTAGVGTLTTNLFLGMLPATPDNCVAVFEYAGLQPDLAHDGAEVEKPGLQVWVRNTSYATGRANCDLVIRALHPTANKTIGASFYQLIRVIQSPIPLGQDCNDRHEWSINFEVKKER